MQTVNRFTPTKTSNLRKRDALMLAQKVISKTIDMLKASILKLRYGSRVSIPLKSVHLGRGSSIEVVSKDARIQIGDVYCERNVLLNANAEGILSIGNGVYFGFNDIVITKHRIVIGNGVSFGPNVCIYDHNHAFDSAGYKKNEYRVASVIVGDNTWVGASVIILKGVTIGRNCIIGAGCVIDRDIPDNTIVKSNRSFDYISLKQ